MNTPEHVKRQAKDAVSHSHARSWTRQCSEQDQDLKAVSERLPDHVKRAAKDAIAQSTILRRVSLQNFRGPIIPGPTPTREGVRVAGMMADVHRNDPVKDF